MHYIVKKSFCELYPDREPAFTARIKYSKAFKGYNAKVNYTKKSMEFRLSHAWKSVSDEIQIGLLQCLFNKVYKTNISTVNIDLYNIFLKKIPQFTPITKLDPILHESFKRMNAEYLDGMIELPNLEIGGENFRTLGTYDYGTDTIRISSILLKDPHLMDYVMYHEMLHKKFQYKTTGKRTIHHSKEFREWEKRYKDPEIEDKLKKFLRKEKYKTNFRFF